MDYFELEDLIKKMADCEFLYLTYIFRIIFGVLALVFIGLVLSIPLGLSILLCVYCDQKFGLGSSIASIIIYIIIYFYFDFVKNAFSKTYHLFFKLHC